MIAGAALGLRASASNSIALSTIATLNNWRPIGEQGPFEFELFALAGTSTATEPIFKGVVAVEDGRPPLTVPAGRYRMRWRSVPSSPEAPWFENLGVVIRLPAPNPVPLAVTSYKVGIVSVNWESITGANRYAVVLRKGAEPPRYFVSQSLTFQFTRLSPGKYTWAVAGVVPSVAPTAPGANRNPASGLSSADVGEWSKPGTFTVMEMNMARFEKPTLIWPRGKIAYSTTVPTFTWSMRSPATSYGMRLYKVDGAGKARLIAEEKELKEPFLLAPTGVLAPGNYRWEVVAMADIAPAPIESDAVDFRVVKPFEAAANRGFITVGFGPSRLSYSGTNTNYVNSFEASFAGPYFSAEYSIGSRFRLGLDYATSSLTFDSQTATISGAVLHADYIVPFGRNRTWEFGIGAGLARSSVPEILATSATDYSQANSLRYLVVPALGLTFHLDNFTEFRFGLATSKTLSFKSGAVSGGTLTSSPLPYQINLNARAAWFWPWGLTAGLSWINDGYNYTAPTDQVSISLTGFSFNLGLFYGF